MLSDFLKIIKDKFNFIVVLSYEKVDQHGARYTSFGAFLLISYIFPFFMWSGSHCGDPIVLTIRVIASVLNFLLVWHESWSSSFKKYLPIYWYFTVMFSLPFFASYLIFLDSSSISFILPS